MIQIKKEGILLSKTNHEFENEGVLNPATIRIGDDVHMYYRAVRQGNNSTIGYCRLNGPLNIVERYETPLITPEFDYESQGVEDARITKIDDLYYLTYTAYDGTNARGALATSKDLLHFEKQGLIVPPFTYAHFVFQAETIGNVNRDYYRNHKFYYQEADPEKKIMLWDKNVIFFPRRINGNLVFLHRIRPGIQIVSVKSIKNLTVKFWDNYFLDMAEKIVMDPKYKHESEYIGGGCPPIETQHGWIIIYHGVKLTSKGNVYSACAALLDLNDPSKEISRLPYALFTPEKNWEVNGEVNNVVFPTGTALFGDTLFIYYGAADEQIACASLNFNDLINELLLNIQPLEKS
jgi:beta-1,2-mannobiose phosphorylase / 1,2-beta-oligomannan phosphorylase